MRDLARGTAVNLAGMMARVSRFLATVAATNLFGAEIYGLYDTGWKVAFVFSKVARFGLDRGVVRAAVAARVEGDTRALAGAVADGLALAALAGVAGGLGLWLGADALGRFYAQAALPPALRVMAWALLPMGLATVLLAGTRALRTMRYEVYAHSVGGPLFLLAGTLAAGLTHAGVVGLAGAQVLAATGMLAQSTLYFRRCFGRLGVLRQLRLPRIRGPLARFSLPVMLSDVLTTAIWSLDQLILLKFASAASVGIYAVARQASTVMKKAPQASGPILGPIVADLSKQGRPAELEEHLASLFRWTLVVNLVYLGPVWLLGDRLLLLFGADFAQGATVFWVLSLGMVAYGVSLPLEGLMIMRGRPYANLACNALWLVGLLLLAFWLIPSYGALGAAWASTLSLAGVAAGRLVDAARADGILPLRRGHLKPVAAAIAGGAAGMAVQAATGLAPALLSDAATLLAFLAVYGSTLYGLGLAPEDRALLRRARVRLAEKRAADTATGVPRKEDEP